MNAADFPRVGLQDAIAALAVMPGYLDSALHACGADELALRPSEDGFSLVEQACHLRDLEREGYLVRMRRILAEDTPALEAFDGDAVAKARDYLAADAHAAARDFAAARREVIALIAPLGDGELARAAIFDGDRITLADLIAMMCDHDRGHRLEIEALVDAMESP
jgi:glutathione S-transferase